MSVSIWDADVEDESGLVCHSKRHKEDDSTAKKTNRKTRGTYSSVSC